MGDSLRFKVIYSREVIDFLDSIDKKAKAKILYDINKSKYVVDSTLFKKLADSDLWEFRILFNRVHYRILAFWDKDEDALVVTTHGIIKKTDKTPKKEINKARAIMAEYYNSKK